MRHPTLRASVIAGLLAVMLSGCGQSGNETKPVPTATARPAEKVQPAPVAAAPASPAEKAPPLAPGEHPAAVPASAAEWADTQEFVQSIWDLTLRQERAQKKREADVAIAAKNRDFVGLGQAQVDFLEQLGKSQKALDRIEVPEVADQDASRFMADAYDALKASMLLNRAQTQALMGGMVRPDQMPSEEDMAEVNRAISVKNGMSVMSLFRVYWTYGYDSKDVEDKTFALKKGAKPAQTVSFNRE